VRVERLSIAFEDGAKTLGRIDRADDVFLGAGLESDPHVDAGERAVWGGLCLETPAGADRALLRLDLVQRRGLRKLRSRQTVELPLRAPSHPPRLALPVSGWWRVTQGHTCASQHRRGRFGGEFAWDLVAINDAGRSFGPHYDSSHRNADTETFGREVLSPVGGTIVEAVDGIADNDGLREFPRRSIVDEALDPKWIFGNYVVIDAGGGAFVLLGHLERDSISVAKGEVVAAGDVLARAGNSGSTIDSHLHVQVMDRADAADPSVSGVPAVFTDFVEITAQGTEGAGEAMMRHVASGDPPQGAVLITPGASPNGS
jgi:Peptidase family M23